MTEDHARTLSNCPGCGESKSEGLIVCWGCFKHGTDLPVRPAFKWFGGSLDEWIKKKKHD